ncbi:3-hydroxyacyl-CoA dehydrogenase NAD-binding domain-containing protein [Aestuariivita boseongensis]|uniref:3-hydroxyacyl-CoA dehydrogenase NAD-binding domain-containing protein n=1 Tax=Aestuariivita boseongensis TaxID=1470562 RepID=UPI00068195B1|nr:3-hydroxyacyl-CoA dehydrogenase NAD-binding domain-containing protein [Aestuariivita boseongensis]
MTQTPIAILGSSATGLSLALACAAADLPVRVVDPDTSALERAQDFARKDDARAAARITFHSDPSALAGAGMIFDALDMAERDSHGLILPPDAVVATPYPTPLTGVALTRQLRFVPFQPMQLRHLTELTRFAETSDQTLALWQDLAQKIGRVPVVLPDGAASVGLHLQDHLHAACDDLLIRGAILWELDEAMTAFGFDLGFYEAQDLTGLDVAYARRKAQAQPSKIADRAVEEGRIGKKIGWGWYRYPGGGGAVIDPLIEDLIREEAWFAGIDQRPFTGAEVMAAILDALRAALADIQAKGTVTSASDLRDIVVHGLGYPVSRLDAIGL